MGIPCSSCVFWGRSQGVCEEKPCWRSLDASSDSLVNLGHVGLELAGWHWWEHSGSRGGFQKLLSCRVGGGVCSPSWRAEVSLSLNSE